MKVISTINFKGGVGKTTVTWLLAKHAAEQDGKKVLVVDADAQMSLTLAVGLDEENGSYVPRFGEWYRKKHKQRGRTLLDAIYRYYEHASGNAPHFNFPINDNFIYQVTPDLHFIPSTEDLYWLELQLQLFKPEHVKSFIRALLGKIEHSKFDYDAVFFNCPPSFTALSYSVLSNCSLILIPVNPDVFAATGLQIMISGLKERIQPWPEPKIAVFMNKARLYRDRLTHESESFLSAVRQTAKNMAEKGIDVRLCSTYIPERAAIRKALNFGRFPQEFRPFFSNLWREIKSIVKL